MVSEGIKVIAYREGLKGEQQREGTRGTLVIRVSGEQLLYCSTVCPASSSYNSVSTLLAR